MDISLREAKKQADRLIARFKELGIEIKRTQALEGVAAIHNFSDWNRFQSHASIAPKLKPSLPNRLLYLRPGEGKSSTLALLFSDAIRLGNGVPVWIDCNDGSTDLALPSLIDDQVMKITVEFDSDGQLGDLPPVPASVKAIWIALHNPMMRPYLEGGRDARTKAFINLSKASSSWLKHIKANINLVLLDELHVIEQSQSNIYTSAFSDWTSDSVMLIAATQYIKDIPDHAMEQFEVITTNDSAKGNDQLIKARKLVALDFSSETAQLIDQWLQDDSLIVEGTAKLVLTDLHRKPYKLDISNPRAKLFKQIIDEWNAQIRAKKQAATS